MLGLAGSPFSILGIPAAIAASLLQWGLLGLARRKIHLKFRVVLGFLVLHYLVAALVLFGHSSQFAEWEYLQQAPRGINVLFVLGLTCYVIGQCFLWGTSMQRKLRP